MLVKITLNQKEVEAFISNNSPEGDDFALYANGDEIGKIVVSNISRRGQVILNATGKRLFQCEPYLNKETLQIVLDAQTRAIEAKRGTYVETADEKAEWIDDQFGHMLLKGRR